MEKKGPFLPFLQDKSGADAVGGPPVIDQAFPVAVEVLDIAAQESGEREAPIELHGPLVSASPEIVPYDDADQVPIAMIMNVDLSVPQETPHSGLSSSLSSRECGTRYSG